MGDIHLIDLEARFLSHRDRHSLLRETTLRHADEAAPPTEEPAGALTEGWRAYWLGFLGGLALAIIIPLWSGLKEQSLAVRKFEAGPAGAASESLRTPAQALPRFKGAGLR